jgi:hypothetical protein
MANESTSSVAVVVPNWNGKDEIPACLDSLQKQSVKAEIIVVENGSTDGSVELISSLYPDVTLLKQPKNLGFAGGVNVGIRYALQKGYTYVALFNNDAVADKDWLGQLVSVLGKNDNAGIATCKFMDIEKKHLDSTGDIYTTWGLPYPRGRGEKVSAEYDKEVEIFGASGGASLYRGEMLQHIGLFDEKFFAYYEDVDISYRAQLAGWKVLYVPKAIAYHQIGATSGKVKGFTTYQTMKNLPMLFWKNTPWRYVPRIFPRLFLAYWSMMAKAMVTGRGWPAIKGQLVFIKNHPHIFKERRKIQKLKQVPDEYIWSILVKDLPPNAVQLRALRSKWWKLTKRKVHS